MNARKLKLPNRFRFGHGGRKGIAEIIATLLLILIAVAAAAVVYTYVLNFVGNVSQNSGGNTSQIRVDSFCVSSSTGCATIGGAGTSYFIVVRNVGTVSISINPASEPALYFTDATGGNSFATTCQASNSTVRPGGTYVCSSTVNNSVGVRAGDTVTVKVVDPDGGTTLATTKAVS